MQNYYDDLAGYPASITMFNHPGTTFGDFTDFAYWTPQRDQAISLIEVGNGDGTNKQLNSGYWRSDSYYDRALAKGWHLAPANNQDNHSANWGTSNNHRTVVLATELTRDAIYNALANRRVYSTENNTMKVDFTINGAVLGTVFDESPETLEIHISAENSSAALGKIALITKNGAEAETQTFETLAAEWDFTIPADQEYYYVKIVQPNGDMTLTAPIWVKEVQVEQQGVSSVNLVAGTPLYGTPIDLTTKLFNDAASGNFTVNSIVYTDADGLIITTPCNRNSVGAGFQRYTYSAEELAVLQRYAAQGGNLLLMARADYGEFSGDYRTFVLMNAVLEQFGVTTKINGDELVLNNTSTYQFSIPAGAFTKNGLRTFNRTPGSLAV